MPNFRNDGFGWFWKALDGFGRFWKVLEGFEFHHERHNEEIAWVCVWYRSGYLLILETDKHDYFNSISELEDYF